MLPANALHGAPASLTVGLLGTLAPLAVEMPRALALLGALPPLELRGALVLLTAEPFGRLVLPAVGLHGALTPLPVEPLECWRRSQSSRPERRYRSQSSCARRSAATSGTRRRSRRRI